MRDMFFSEFLDIPSKKHQIIFFLKITLEYVKKNFSAYTCLEAMEQSFFLLVITTGGSLIFLCGFMVGMLWRDKNDRRD